MKQCSANLNLYATPLTSALVIPSRLRFSPPVLPIFSHVYFLSLSPSLSLLACLCTTLTSAPVIPSRWRFSPPVLPVFFLPSSLSPRAYVRRGLSSSYHSPAVLSLRQACMHKRRWCHLHVQVMNLFSLFKFKFKKLNAVFMYLATFICQHSKHC